MKKKKILIIILILVLLISSILLIIKIKNKKVDGKFEYNEVNNEYEYKNIKILNDLELTYYVDKNKYGIVGTIENNSKVNYKDIEITLELFDDKGNKIDDFIIKIDKMSVKDKIRINEEIKDYGVLVYEHKITNIKGKEEK